MALILCKVSATVPPICHSVISRMFESCSPYSRRPEEKVENRCWGRQLAPLP